MMPCCQRLLIAFAAAAVASTCAWGEAELSGYLEHRFQATAGSHQIALGNLNRARVQCSGQVSEWSHATVVVDLYTRHGDLARQLADSLAQDPAESESVGIDRAYADLYFSRFDLSLGKQRIAWGVSYLWSPLDVFNRINLLEPKEEKEGINALRISVPLGQVSSLGAVIVPASHMDEAKSGLRGALTVGLTDMAGSWVYDGTSGDHMLGVDAKGEWGVGWWSELAYVIRDNEHLVRLSAGSDYTIDLKNGLNVLGEYFYDGSGEREKARYDFSRLADEATLARDYLFLMARYPLDGHTSGTLSWVRNLNDGSGVVTPSLQRDLFPNTRLDVGAYIRLGAQGGEFRAPGTHNAMFVWLRLDF